MGLGDIFIEVGDNVRYSRPRTASRMIRRVCGRVRMGSSRAFRHFTSPPPRYSMTGRDVRMGRNRGVN